MEKTADAVIIGGGILGASTAHFLAKKGIGKVVLLEKRTLAAVSTGHSAANIRCAYSNPVTIQLALRAFEMFENDREQLSGDTGFTRTGMMILFETPP
jgi:sarcosine oxidase subunit beta